MIAAAVGFVVGLVGGLAFGALLGARLEREEQKLKAAGFRPLPRRGPGRPGDR